MGDGLNAGAQGGGWTMVQEEKMRPEQGWEVKGREGWPQGSHS